MADEPTTALDVTVRAQIFDLLRRVQDDLGVGIIMITHDIGTNSELADRVAVMYAGLVVKQGRADDILVAPAHPYTQGLIGCIPTLDIAKAARTCAGRDPRHGAAFASVGGWMRLCRSLRAGA